MICLKNRHVGHEEIAALFENMPYPFQYDVGKRLRTAGQDSQYNGGVIIANGQQVNTIPNQMMGGRGGRGGWGGFGGGDPGSLGNGGSGSFGSEGSGEAGGFGGGTGGRNGHGKPGR